jgi:citrate synthase
VAEDVFEVCGRDGLIDLAEELANQAMKDPYFQDRKLYPNVDFYSGLIYFAIGFPKDMFPVLFALGRCAGWLAHWKESLEDKEEKIYRPGQIYMGHKQREFVPLSKRHTATTQPLLKPRSTSGGRVKNRRLLSKL